MKMFLIILTTSLFLNFTNTSHANSSLNNNREPAFTITHKANNNETVSVYFYNEDNFAKIRKMFPEECIKLARDQFPYLTILAGVNGGDNFKPLCNAQHTKHNCQPQNYNIVDSRFIFDDYRIKPTKHPNTSEKCTDIAEWIETKPVFTVINKAGYSEDVYISKRNDEELSTNNPRYTLNSGKCLKIKTSQFYNLIIEVSDSSGLFGFSHNVENNKILCGGSKKTKCLPKSYFIMDIGMMSDHYIMEDFNHPNAPNANCIELEQWIKQQE